MKGKGDPRKDVVEGVAVKAARFLRHGSAYKQQTGSHCQTLMTTPFGLKTLARRNQE